MWPIRRPHSPDGQEMWQLKLADSQCSRETHACTSRSQSRPPSHSSCALSLVWAGWVPTGCAALVPPHSPAEPRHPARYVKVMQVLCNLVCTDCCWNEVFMLSLIVVEQCRKWLQDPTLCCTSRDWASSSFSCSSLFLAFSSSCAERPPLLSWLSRSLTSSVGRTGRTVSSQIVATITIQHCVQVKNYFMVYFNCIATFEALHHNFC